MENKNEHQENTRVVGKSTDQPAEVFDYLNNEVVSSSKPSPYLIDLRNKKSRQRKTATLSPDLKKPQPIESFLLLIKIGKKIKYFFKRIRGLSKLSKLWFVHIIKKVVKKIAYLPLNLIKGFGWLLWRIGKLFGMTGKKFKGVFRQPIKINWLIFFVWPIKFIKTIVLFFITLPYSLSFRPVKKWLRPLISFVIITLILILPLQALTYYYNLQRTSGEIAGLTLVAWDNLQSGADAAVDLDLPQAEHNFQWAEQGFNLAQKQLEATGQTMFNLTKLVPNKGKTIKAAEQLLNIGKNVALAGKHLTQGLTPLMDKQGLKISGILSDEVVSLSNQEYLTDKLINLQDNLAIALQAIDIANADLEKINIKALPKAVRPGLEQARDILTSSREKLTDLSPNLDILLKVLGAKQTQRYLLIFQNNAELRASGGFIGSLALVDIDRGQIKKIEIPGGGPYDLKAGLFKNIVAPQPLHLVNARWELQDSNWWPDWPTSACKIAWFYTASSGPSVDGVIALTPNVIQQLLTITGPIDLTEQYGVIIDADNFIQITQTEAEKKYDETRTSKQFIADLTPLILTKALTSDNQELSKVFNLLIKSLQSKQLLFYSQDDNLEKLVLEKNWGGALHSTNGDYLSVVHTNIAGGKTDIVMKEKVNQQITISSDGSIIKTITITREHQGIISDPFIGVKNIDYLRVYVPKDSKLLSATGFVKPWSGLFQQPPVDYEIDQDLQIAGIRFDQASQTKIYNELDKTVFANWVQTDVGETSTVQLKYQLPIKLPVDTIRKDNQSWLTKIKQLFNPPDNLVSYSLLVQKQAGSQDNDYTIQISLPNNIDVSWQEPELTVAGQRLWRQEPLNQDKFYGIVFKIKQ